MILNGVDFETYFKNYPDENGYFGPYGGAYISEELKEAAEYCRVRGVRVYLTLNIMLKNSELNRAIDIVRTASAAGISGIIVQDIGLARIIHDSFPDMPLHASTQMSVNSPSALKILKEKGLILNEIIITAKDKICFAFSIS